ncbi:MAG: beta-N-acetylhexosaminidase [Clostridia bacterium]|jgi:hexosaminidase
MKIKFLNVPDDLKQGLQIMAGEFRFVITDENPEYVIDVVPCEEDKVYAKMEKGSGVIRYAKKIRFFRGLTRLLETFSEGKDSFVIEETPYFDLNGAMFDIAQGNAVIKPEYIKRIIIEMAKMGLNMLMIYMEDNYVLENRPFFGYMRGKYTEEELRDCDEFADLFGIEMIPCMQTLAHLYDSLKWPVFNEFKDDDDTLLVGHPETYKFIEEMIVAASKPFKSKRIHIGMDEAMHLGLGQYLSKNGYTPKFEIMIYHLKRVLEIVEKHGLKPMIWSDMFFRAVSKTNSYYDTSVVFTDEMKAMIPKNVQPVYWDYYHITKDFYEKYVDLHKTLADGTVFAGAVWSWIGYGTNYEKTFITTDAALEVCKEKGIKEVFATIWGDDMTEANVFSTLLGLQLYAEHGYSLNPDRETVMRRFEFCCQTSAKAFFALDRVDRIKPKDPLSPDPAKYCMWQDILMGMFDENMKDYNLTEHYTNLSKEMAYYESHGCRYSFIFRYIRKLSDVLAIKGDLGKKITKAYHENDKEYLKEVVEVVLPELKEKVRILWEDHMNWFFEINKPQGWEIMDIRYGGVMARIDSVKKRLSDYLDGKIYRLEELEEKKLPYHNQPGITGCNNYARIPSASRISIGATLR